MKEKNFQSSRDRAIVDSVVRKKNFSDANSFESLRIFSSETCAQVFSSAARLSNHYFFFFFRKGQIHDCPEVARAFSCFEMKPDGSFFFLFFLRSCISFDDRNDLSLSLVAWFVVVVPLLRKCTGTFLEVGEQTSSPPASGAERSSR